VALSNSQEPQCGCGATCACGAASRCLCNEWTSY
jgi:hypothetical protein